MIPKITMGISLNEKNPKRFKLKKDGEFIDKKFKKEPDLDYPADDL